MRDKRRIVILGAGFGGLRAALRLGRWIKRQNLEDKCQVTLVDQHSYHTYTPMLYEIASVSEDLAAYDSLKKLATQPVEEIVKNLPIEFLRAKVSDLDLEKGMILTEEGNGLIYDYLIVALGSEVNYFNVPGLAEFSCPFKTFTDAVRVRTRMTTVAGAIDPGQMLRVVVAGAGSTGIELGGELALWLCQEKGILRAACRWEMTLVDGAATVLPSFVPKVVASAAERMDELGVKVVVGEMIKEVRPDRILLASGQELPFDVLVWAGGIGANSLLKSLPARRDQKGLIAVSESLEILPEEGKEFPGRVFGLGDCVRVVDSRGSAAACVAPEAISQADTIARNIILEIEYGKWVRGQKLEDGPKPTAHIVKNWPYVIPIGGKYAVAKMGTMILRGRLAWLLKGLVELRYLISIMPFWRAVRVFFAAFRIFVRNDRLG